METVRTLGDYVDYYKIGMQLFYREGPAIVHTLKNDFHKKIFLDLKINDIPNTVEHAVKSLSSLGVDMMTLFTSGDGVVAAKRSAPTSLAVLNVTVLTSQADEGNTAGDVEKRTSLSLDHGADGIVCSGLETKSLRQKFGRDFLIVNPGIRMESLGDDQQRTVTPRMAMENGASYIVVGRPVTADPNPRQAAIRILDSL
jgi:orotidine-5'-phosphate decarboxylase